MTSVTKKKVFVAGHGGMVGSAIVRLLERAGGCTLATRTHAELDLTDSHAVRAYLSSETPDEIYLAAAKVGGIHANNSYPAEFIHQNLMIAANVIHEACRVGVRKLLFLGSSCIYPRLASQPMTEEALLSGPLEPTNESYAIAKIAGIKLCESYNRQYGTDYRSVMPANLYGPGDNYHPENSHVIPGLIRRFHDAKVGGATSVVVWGTGTPRREFLHVDDLATACMHVMSLDKPVYDSLTMPARSHLNVGTGTDVSITELAKIVAQVTGFTGSIVFDPSMPDGAPRKLMSASRLKNTGWMPKIPLQDGLRHCYAEFCRRYAANT